MNLKKKGIIAIVAGVIILAVATIWLFSELEPKMPKMAQAQEISEPILSEPTIVVEGEETTTWIDIDVPYMNFPIYEAYESWWIDEGLLVIKTKDNRVIIVGGDFIVRTVK